MLTAVPSEALGCTSAGALRLPVATRRLLEAALERASEAGGVLISYGGGNLLDAHISMHQEVGCLQQALFGEQLAQTQSGVLLKQVLKARFTQVTFEREPLNSTKRL